VPDLTFRIASASIVTFAAVPLMAFKLEVVNPDTAVTVHSGVLRCQVHIEAARRGYASGEQARLVDLFGEPDRWATTLKSLLWTHITVALPQFGQRTYIDVPIPCSFDFNLAATKYFDGLASDDIPLLFLFSGTVFYSAAPDQALQAVPISWDKEARFRLPAATWRELSMNR